MPLSSTKSRSLKIKFYLSGTKAQFNTKTVLLYLLFIGIRFSITVYGRLKNSSLTDVHLLRDSLLQHYHPAVRPVNNRSTTVNVVIDAPLQQIINIVSSRRFTLVYPGLKIDSTKPCAQIPQAGFHLLRQQF